MSESTYWNQAGCANCGYEFKTQGKPRICEVCAEVRENFPELFAWLDAIYKHQRGLIDKFETQINAKLDSINFRLDILDEKISKLIDLNSPK